MSIGRYTICFQIVSETCHTYYILVTKDLHFFPLQLMINILSFGPLYDLTINVLTLFKTRYLIVHKIVRIIIFVSVGWKFVSYIQANMICKHVQSNVRISHTHLFVKQSCRHNASFILHFIRSKILNMLYWNRPPK